MKSIELNIIHTIHRYSINAPIERKIKAIIDFRNETSVEQQQGRGGDQKVRQGH